MGSEAMGACAQMPSHAEDRMCTPLRGKGHIHKATALLLHLPPLALLLPRLLHTCDDGCVGGGLDGAYEEDLPMQHVINYIQPVEG
jgi:hypothetical protein